jgi:hypothetical protein
MGVPIRGRRLLIARKSVVPNEPKDALVAIVAVWVGFLVFVLVVLAFDLGAFSGKKSQVISARQALFRTACYATLAVLFTVFVYYAYERHWFGLGLNANNGGNAGGHHGHIYFFDFWLLLYL